MVFRANSLTLLLYHIVGRLSRGLRGVWKKFRVRILSMWYGVGQRGKGEVCAGRARFGPRGAGPSRAWCSSLRQRRHTKTCTTMTTTKNTKNTKNNTTKNTKNTKGVGMI